MISRFINRILIFVFGLLPDGDQRVILFSRQDGWSEGSWRFRFNTGKKTGLLFRAEWNLWTNFCFFAIKRGGEDGNLLLQIAFPPVALWFELPFRPNLDSPRWDKWNVKYGGYPGSAKYTTFDFFELRIFSNAIWWSFLKFDWGWSCKMPKWMDGNFHPIDFLFGTMKYRAELLSTKQVLIPMPEGAYPASVTLEFCTWKRPRLPWVSARRKTAKVDLSIGIPHEGKGENSWDCGTDALHSLSVGASTVEEAISKTVESVLGSRRKYDGNVMAKYPAPLPAQLSLEFGG